MKRILPFILAALFASAIVPARATDEHDYEKGEYAIIRDGLAPDKHKSLAAHGEGPGGHGDFHVWMMAEPAHRKIEALADISDKNNLDTGPNAYHTFCRRIRGTSRSAFAATAMSCNSISTPSPAAARDRCRAPACSGK